MLIALPNSVLFFKLKLSQQNNSSGKFYVFCGGHHCLHYCTWPRHQQKSRHLIGLNRILFCSGNNNQITSYVWKWIRQHTRNTSVLFLDEVRISSIKILEKFISHMDWEDCNNSLLSNILLIYNKNIDDLHWICVNYGTTCRFQLHHEKSWLTTCRPGNRSTCWYLPLFLCQAFWPGDSWEWPKCLSYQSENCRK